MKTQNKPGALLAAWRRYQQRRANRRQAHLTAQTIGRPLANAMPPRRVCLANVAEGTHAGRITKGVDAIITERFLLAKIGSAANRIAVCGAADSPIGVITD